MGAVLTRSAVRSGALSSAAGRTATSGITKEAAFQSAINSAASSAGQTVAQEGFLDLKHVFGTSSTDNESSSKCPCEDNNYSGGAKKNLNNYKRIKKMDNKKHTKKTKKITKTKKASSKSTLQSRKEKEKEVSKLVNTLMNNIATRNTSHLDKFHEMQINNLPTKLMKLKKTTKMQKPSNYHKVYSYNYTSIQKNGKELQKGEEILNDSTKPFILMNKLNNNKLSRYIIPRK